MMDCGQIQTLYTAYTDQELDPQNLLLFEKHLGNCPHCRREWEDFQQIIQRLQAVQPLPAPADLLPGIHDKLANRSLGQRLRRAIQEIMAPISLTAGASAMAAAMLIVFLYSGSIPQPDAPATGGMAQQEATPGVLPTPLTTLSVSLGPSTPGRPAGQPAARPSIFNGQHPEGDYSAHLFYRYLLNREHPDLDHVSIWQQHPDAPGSSLFVPPSHQQQIGTPLMPDVTIRIHHLSPEGLGRLHNQMKEEGNWMTKCYHRDYFLVLLKPGEIDALYDLLQQHHLPFSSHTAQDADRLYQKPLLVAIRL